MRAASFFCESAKALINGRLSQLVYEADSGAINQATIGICVHV